MIQQRNVHNISQDFFGEHPGYIQVHKLLDVVKGVRFGSIEDMLFDSYSALCAVGMFDARRELGLLESYLKSFKG